MAPAVMGILNVTPDSFSDGGRFLDPDAAVEHGLRLAAEGAAIVDVGGESTRPGAAPVDAAEERARVVPVIEALVGQGVACSIDTRHAGVAEAAVEAGASMLNDVSASLHEVAAAAGVPWVAMHMLGDPRTMQDDPRYDDVVAEVSTFLAERARKALAAGVPRDGIVVDPGIGFGKGPDHNRALLAHLDALKRLGYPVLLGVSRKSFIGRLTAEGGEAPPPADRVEGSLAAAVAGIAKGADIVRVHDVRATVRAARVADWILR